MYFIFENINSQSGGKIYYPLREPRNELLLLPQSDVRTLHLYGKLRLIARRVSHQNTFYLIWM